MAIKTSIQNDDVLDELRQEQAEFDATPENYKKAKKDLELEMLFDLVILLLGIYLKE